jgi:EAL domain-containing protein (putative c-di-GMP-specific phosphodiesterase class I)
MDRIKIAQNFVLELGTAASTAAGSAAVVKATIGLARELGIDVIAEGVETAEQLRLVKSWRCREVQGYFFAKPLSAEDLVPLLQAGRIVPPPLELKPAA